MEYLDDCLVKLSDGESNIYSVFGLSAREAIQTTERLISIVRNLEQGKTINLYYLLILMCLSNKKRSYYERLQKVSLKGLNYNDSLISELDKEFHWKGRKIFLRIEPKKHYEILNSPDSLTRSSFNNYKDGVYSVDIRDLFCEFHTAYKDNLSDRAPYKNAISSLLNQLNNSYSNMDWEYQTQNDINKWVTVMSFDLSNENSYSFGDYNDLVELSTALDI
ncbi:hypothetical protein QNE44_001614 [Vibrio harveyi]|nr:hypothetical protein [Vibrio harveyi]